MKHAAKPGLPQGGPVIGERPAVVWSAAALALGLSVLAWGILFAAVPPAGQDFPLGDDWAFSRGALAFARGQGIHYYEWASMPQLGQWLWAVPFLKIFGFSHVALRLSTIVLSWIGLLAFFDLLRQEGLAARVAGLATAALALNPLFFVLQGTFMTDVPALSLALGALALYMRAARSGRIGYLLAATGVALLAAITRQTTLAVPLVAAVLLGQSPRLRWRLAAIVSVLLPVAVGLGIHFWFNARKDIRPMQPTAPTPAMLLLLPYVIVHTAGLAALPLLLLAGWPRARIVFAVGVVLLLGTAVGWYLAGDVRFPYLMGMLSLEGAYSPGLVVGERPPLLTPLGRWVGTLLGCLAGAGLLARFAEDRPSLRRSPLLLFTLLQIPILFLVPGLYDRYLLVLLPGALCIASPRQRSPVGRWALGSVVVLLLGILSVGVMHDWLSWNTARWALGERAVKEHHIDPQSIEGGFEWDGWYAPPSLSRAPRRPLRGFVLPLCRRLFPQVSGLYALSYEPVPQCQILDREPYTVWLPPQRRYFYLLEAPQAPKPP